MSLHRLVALGMIAVALAGCTGVTRSRTKMPAEPDSGSTPPQWTADKPFEARRQDFVECLARASQTARSIASGARDRATHAAVLEDARGHYMALCLQSRGWYQGTPLAPGEEAPPRTAPVQVQDAHGFRQCAQAALVKLGVYHGPVDGDDSPMWEEVWIRYLDSHVDLAHDQRQAPIRMVIDQELAAIHEHINWDACAS
jgi:hypothetical protein